MILLNEEGVLPKLVASEEEKWMGSNDGREIKIQDIGRRDNRSSEVWGWIYSEHKRKCQRNEIRS